MRVKPRSISISSGKGGTGKTTLTANLGIALGNLGHDVTILDGDLAMANLAIILGMHKCELNFLDVLAGKANVGDVVYKNYGIKVVPTGFRFEDIQDLLASLKKDRVEQSIDELLRQTEFLLIDAPAGIADSTIISILAAREMIPVTNPTYASLVDCYKTIRLANVLGAWTRGLVVNRVGKAADISLKDIEHFMSKALGAMPILGEIPDDPKVLADGRGNSGARAQGTRRRTGADLLSALAHPARPRLRIAGQQHRVAVQARVQSRPVPRFGVAVRRRRDTREPP